ncbi:hypothetical protein [uncultured Proteiniphilum sp.]|uniref:COG1470 family protein n=1 Tax=uncultured Proteiniphilum sp. TaxID=497637 RepID=UPI0026133FE7|nr:hypothetical protein [uncultured Proteiniphilum sp.]
MKNFFYIIATLVLALGILTVSCEKDPDNIENQPTVSISADESFDAEKTAKLTITLSAVSGKDVEVRLAKADVQSGKTNVPATYDKKVTVAAGKTSATIDVEADVLGLKSGDYQTAIKIESAEGAKIGEKAVAYINLSYAFKPEVNLYADPSFAGDKKAKLKVTLSKATTVPVVVTLETDPQSKAEAEYENKITIPAGQTQAEIDVTVKVPANIVPGIYPVTLKIASVENGFAGTVKSIKIDLLYPFAVAITVDGDFDDWKDPNVQSWSLPEGDVLYQSMKNLKLAANGKYVFVYMEFYDPGFDFNMPFDMYVDADGDPNTGAIVAAIDNDTYYPPYDDKHMGLEYYIELGLHDGDHYNDFYSWGGVYKYEGEHGANVFSGLRNLGGTYDGSVIFAAGSLDTQNIGRIEIQMLRSWFGIKGNKVRIAVKNMNGADNWSAYGLLPQGNVVNGERQLVDMASIYLPAYQE